MRTETRTCACGAEFTAYIKVQDGEDVLDGLTLCLACRRKATEEELKQERLAKIPGAREDQRDLWQEDYNLPGKFLDKTFENFDRKLQPKAYDILKGYHYDWDDTVQPPVPPQSLVLLSPNLYGVGKTHLVAALFNQIVETEDTILSISKDGSFSRRRCPVYFTAENSLINRIRQSFNQSRDDDKETDEDIYRQLAKINLLAIDDIGKVRPRDYSFLQGVLFRIINDRYEGEMPLILTTNLSFAELEEHIGGACADRLLEMVGSNFIIMKGQSYRKKATKGNAIPGA